MKKNKYRPLPDYLTIQPSKVEGLGLFAIKDIPAYEVIGMTHAKWYGEPNNLLRTPLGGFINHSDTPNCQRSQIRVKPGFDKWSIMTLEDIEEGDELTLKYKLYDPQKK